MQEAGIRRITMVSGDRKPVADRVAKEIGIPEVVAECLPQDKVEFVRACKAKGFRVAVVGDGSFMMTPHIVATAVEYHIPAVWVVWNNYGYSAIRDQQIGMFNYSGLSKDQMVRLRSEFGVYGTDSGRMCVAALNNHNVAHVCKAIATVLG